MSSRESRWQLACRSSREDHDWPCCSQNCFQQGHQRFERDRNQAQGMQDRIRSERIIGSISNHLGCQLGIPASKPIVSVLGLPVGNKLGSKVVQAACGLTLGHRDTLNVNHSEEIDAKSFAKPVSIILRSGTSFTMRFEVRILDKLSGKTLYPVLGQIILAI